MAPLAYAVRRAKRRSQAALVVADINELAGVVSSRSRVPAGKSSMCVRREHPAEETKLRICRVEGGLVLLG